MKRFLHVLINIAVANTSTFFLWSALSFWLYLETHSVLILSILSGTFMTLVTLSGMFFGTIVDKHRKKEVIAVSSIVALIFLLLAGSVFLFFDRKEIADISSSAFWIFSLSILLSALVSNLRSIALSTTVSILVPKEDYARANGMVGMVQGVGMIANTVFSGLVIGRLGLEWAMYITLILSGLALLHLLFVPIPEDHLHHDPEVLNKQVDFKGAIKAIRSVPGLMALIFFTTFNNFIGGVIMVLLDPYGLEMFSVEMWGIVLGITGTGFIFGGMAITKKGLGKQPLRTLLYGYVIGSLICLLFTVREWAWLFLAGIFLYMFFVPFIEAAEQTIIQTVVPKIKQGRVFGFAQTVESAATPVSSYLIGPIAQFSIIPFMESDAGKQTFGWLLGEGNARGIALTFVLAGLFMLLLSLLAFRTRAYHRLSESFKKSL
ncbi:MAG: MFS transporter [Petrimonas sp.]|jgi:DHA3 family multidrug efflux protein-like MFS transporter|nr:MFS transporter [Petrimonas sp.]MDX9775716.1 MFS transporter [Petrimonas sp.]HCA99563.1 MFS transporter [Porphyromonadaceae bacterium]